jgi:hypothetical protein
MAVVKCDIPSVSVLDRNLIDTAYFRDSYSAPLSMPHVGIVPVFIALFAHHPIWMKAILIIRNRIATLCGLQAASPSETLHFRIRDDYSVGEKIGVWPILSLTDNELVAGRDNKHLNFRLSVLKVTDGETARVVVSTICMVNNTFGKIYLFFIVPFHKWGVQRLISNAAIAGRL